MSRSVTTVISPAENTPSFLITAANKSYKHQYSNIYFVRLRILRPYIEDRATRKWRHVAGHPPFIPRVLDVVKSQLCFIIGTVYIDMALKPNVLEDIARDLSIPPPPPKQKFYSDDDFVMIEDESGRIRLVGERLKEENLVTGVIIGALGVETNSGEFEVVDICFPGMPPQSSTSLDVHQDDQMDVDDGGADKQNTNEWIAMVSGLDIGSPTSTDAIVQMLVEYLVGELGGNEDIQASSHISRLIIAGNSLASGGLAFLGNENEEMDRKPRRIGDSASFSPHPMQNLSSHLLDIARVMPIHILPGPTDPSGIILPQQRLPRAMFGPVSSYSTFVCETNPTYLKIASGSDPSQEEILPHTSSPQTRTVLVNAGQPLDDMFKYLPSPPVTRLAMVESTLQWRHMAPTAPDTLWCHPYFTTDPFVLTETPDIYVIGNQPRFQTRLVTEEQSDDSDEGNVRRSPKRCRIILLPEFAKTGTMVLVNLRTLGVKSVRFTLGGV